MTSRLSPNPRRPKTAAEFVAETLRRSILSGELQAGTRLALGDLASTLDVSTTPVREALRELSFEGLVQLDSYRGGTVNAVTETDVAEIIRIRQVLEPMAIREAVEAMSEERLEEAEAVLDTMSLEDGWTEWVEANLAFHNSLYEASPSRRLIAMIQGMQDATVMFISNVHAARPAVRAEADHQHREILAAFRAGDAEKAIEITLEHVAMPVRH
ncbi:MAG: GntR family transcriptional regulator [Acidimicrobiia bacterium]|nr:GntR family transcriptional regulator [Acidimicrobiia bacterium]